MKLAETIIANQKAGFLDKNEQLVGSKLRELVFNYTGEVLEVLHKCGITASTVLPPKVILAIVINQLNKNKLLRETITQMLIEMDGYFNADGKGIAVLGGALSAVGTILAGIGRGQTQNTTTQLQQEQVNALQQQQQQQAQQDQKRRTALLITGISILLLIGAIFAIRAWSKAGVQPKLIPAGV